LAKNPSKCLKTAILPLKPTKVDFLKRNCNLEAFRVVFGKKVKKVDPPKIGHFRGGLLSSLLAKKHSERLKMHFLALK